MSVAEGATRLGRKQAEALMTSTCTIRSKTSVLNTATGALVDTFTDVYSGVCRLRVRTEQVNITESAGQQVSVQRMELSIPVDGSGASAVGDGLVATIDTNPLDASMVGVKFQIVGTHFQTYATARRFPVEVTT